MTGISTPAAGSRAEAHFEHDGIELLGFEGEACRAPLKLGRSAALGLYESLEAALIAAGALPPNARNLRLAAPDMLAALNKFEHWSFALGRPDAPCWALSRTAREKAAGERLCEDVETTFA